MEIFPYFLKYFKTVPDPLLPKDTTCNENCACKRATEFATGSGRSLKFCLSSSLGHPNYVCNFIEIRWNFFSYRYEIFHLKYFIATSLTTHSAITTVYVKLFIQV